MLKYIVLTTNKLLPKDALFGRIGGDEFLILLKSNKKDSEKIIENIQKQISIGNIKYKGEVIKTSISYGIATKSNSDETLDCLLQKADEKLYDMKKRFN